MLLRCCVLFTFPDPPYQPFPPPGQICPHPSLLLHQTGDARTPLRGGKPQWVCHKQVAPREFPQPWLPPPPPSAGSIPPSGPILPTSSGPRAALRGGRPPPPCREVRLAFPLPAEWPRWTTNRYYINRGCPPLREMIAIPRMISQAESGSGRQGKRTRTKVDLPSAPAWARVPR